MSASPDESIMPPGAEPTDLAVGEAQLEITLKYDGSEVDDGTMPIENVISALQGFASAYEKLASRHDPRNEHQIRVSAIKKSSFAVVIFAWAFQDPTKVLSVSVDAVRWIVATIIKLLELKKAAKGQPISVQVDGNNNTVVVVPIDGATISIPPEIFEILQSKLVDSDLGKIAAPLKKDKIDKALISARDREGPVGEVLITSGEREYFQTEETVTTTSKPVSVDGHFVSLNKESNRGTFRMQNGMNVKYHLKADDPAGMHADFAHKGPVRIECVAHFDGDLEVKSLDITSVARLQGDLF
jgi:hypothetical protein